MSMLENLKELIDSHYDGMDSVKKVYVDDRILRAIWREEGNDGFELANTLNNYKGQSLLYHKCSIYYDKDLMNMEVLVVKKDSLFNKY